MKKGIALGIVFLATVVLAYIYRWETVGMLQKDAYAFPDREIIQTIQNKTPGNEEKQFELVYGHALDTIYQRAGVLYLGESQVPVSQDLPLYMSNGSILYNVKEEMPVLTDNFEKENWLFDMYESEGVLFNADGERADPFTYIVGELDKGVYLNFQDTVITGSNAIVKIPAHSIQGYFEDHIVYFQYENDRMVGHRMEGLSESSKISIGKNEYGYYEYLEKLGLRQSEKVEATQTPETPEIPTVEEVAVEKEKDKKTPVLLQKDPILFVEDEATLLPQKKETPKEKQEREILEKEVAEKETIVGVIPPKKEKVRNNHPNIATPKPPVVVKKEPQIPTLPESPPYQERIYKPKVNLAPFSSNAMQRWVETTLGVFDPSQRLTGEIIVYVEDESGNVFEQSVSNFAFANKERMTYGLLFYDLPHGQKFKGYGIMTYYDENDTLVTERFGEQEFYTDYSIPTPRADDSVPPEDEDEDPAEKYIEPVVTVEQFTAGVYDIRSKITIDDPQARISNGVLVELKKDGKIYMRRYATQTGTFVMSPLHPDSTYEITVTYEYKNEYLAKVTKDVLTQSIKTLPVSALEPLELVFNNGPIYSSMIQLDGIAYPNAKNTTIPYVAKLVVNIGDKDYTMDALTFKKLGTTPISFVSPKVLNPSTTYEYKILLYDRFGNVLPVAMPLTGTTKTSKGEPVANLKIVSNLVSKTEIKIDIQDKFNTIKGNLKVMVLDRDGKPVSVAIIDPQGQEQPVATEHPITLEGGTITIKNLALKERYDVVVFADYDIEDNNGIQIQKQIGKVTLITAALEDLGKVFLSGKIVELNSSGGTFQLKLDTGVTNALLIHLLSTVTVKITDPQGESTYVPVCADMVDGVLVANDDAFEQFKQGVPFEFTVDSLKSMTEYKVEILAQVMVNQLYDVPTVFSFDQLKTTFRTLKKEALAEIRNNIPGSNTIDLFDIVVTDTDGAVVGGSVTLKVTNQSGVVVASKVLKTNEVYDHITISKLSVNEKYRLEFFAAAYNTGYTYATQKDVYRLENSYEIITNGGLWGQLRLQGLGAYNAATNTYDATLGVTIQDEYGRLGTPPKYYIKAYKNNQKTPFDVKEFNITGFTDPDRIASMVATYAVEKQNNFILELWVNINGSEIKLDELMFDSNGEIVPLRTAADFAKINANPKGRYVVLNDVAVTGYYASNSTNRFTGMLDFQGYKLTLNNDVYLLYYLGNGGVVKNVVVDYTKNTVDPRSSVGAIALSNEGTIQNIFLNYLGGTEVLNVSSGLIARANYATGVIENFVIKLNSNVYMRSSFGGVTDSNSGVIRNGYIYGVGDAQVVSPAIDMDVTYTGGNIGTIAGINNTSGIVENVFSLANITAEGGKFNPTMSSFGLVAGWNDGVIRNVYSTGKLTFEGRSTLVNGPAVGGEGTKKNTLAYYISDILYNNTFNVKVPLEALRDAVWQQRTLGNKFDIEGTVSVGYYPQVKWPSSMPAQEFIPLPKLPLADDIDIANVVVDKQVNELDPETQKGDPNEKYGVVLVTFRNPNYYKIQSVTLDYLDTEVLKGTLGQVDRDGFSRVWIRVNNPQKFYSEYSITKFTYTNGVGSNTKTYVPREFLAFVEFFKPVATLADWKAINLDKYQNYQLVNDLDFSGIAPKEFIIGLVNGTYPAEDYNNGAYGFFGKLDGGIYDAEGNLTGMKTIRNMTANDNVANSGGVFLSLSGTISNLQVENLNINTPVDTRVGFVRIANNGSVIDNVHINNFYGQSKSFLGSMAGVLKYAELKNSSARKSLLEDAGLDMNMGGLVGYSVVGFIQNCYGSDIQIVSDLSEQGLGTGGIVGRVSSSTLRSLYATGHIDTKDINIGGIVGVVENNYLINRFWSDVDISSVVENIGGVVGAYWFDPSGVTPLDGLVLGNLNTTNMTTDKIRRAFGNSVVNKNVYAWAGQKKNGKLPSAATEDGATIVTTEQLKGDEIYRYIMLGDAFDLSETDQGILPKLMNMAGTALLPNQEDHYIGMNDVYVKDLEAEFFQTSYSISATIVHPAGVDIQHLNVEHLKVSTDEVIPYPSGTETRIIVTVDEIERGLDSYYLTGIGYNNDKVADVREIVDFGESMYKTISSVDDWLNVMKESGQNLENYEIDGTLDFSAVNVNAFLSNLKIGRLRGVNNAIIKGITRTESLPNNSFISIVSKELKDISFENIKLTNGSNAGTYFGIVGNCTGTVNNLSFRNIEINGGASTNVAPIGWFSGKMDKIYMKDVKITSNNSNTGGLIGMAQDSQITNVKAEGDITITGKDFTGGIGGRFNYSQLSSSTMDGLQVSSTYGIKIKGNSYVGGMIGYTNYSASIPYNNNLSIKNAKVSGNATNDIAGTYVGGLMGVGSVVSENYLKQNIVDDVLVIGTNQVGGHSGQAPYAESGITVKNSKIFGGTNVGGAIGYCTGYTFSIQSLHVLDSIVSTVYDTAFAPYGTVVSGTGSSVGGLVGSGVAISGTVYNATVSAQKSTSVGGAVGYHPWGYIRNVFVNNTNVLGATQVGGIAGRSNSDVIYSNGTNATVTATGNYVGGIVGYMDIHYKLSGASAPNIRTSYSTSNVTGADYVGGITGYATEGLYAPTNNYGVMFAGNVKATAGSNVDFFININPAGENNTNRFLRARVYDGSRITKGAQVFTPADKGVLPMQANDTSRGSTAELSVTSAQMADVATYTKWGVAYVSDYWITDGLNEGFMPYFKNDVNNIPSNPAYPGLYQEGKNASGQYYDVRRGYGAAMVRQGGIPIPMSVAPMMAMMAMDFTEPQILPIPTFYLGNGAAKLNIDFDAPNAQTYFEIWSNHELIDSVPIEQRSYTLAYDFKTPMEIKVSDGLSEESYIIDPSQYLRTVATDGTKSFYITGDGVVTNGGSKLYGQFINLRGAEGLTEGGTIYNLQSGKIKETVSIGLLETAPLYRANYDGYDIRTYKNYSDIIAADGAVTTQPYQMLIKKNTMTVFDPTLEKVYDGVLIDVIGTSEYCTILGTDGKLVDVKTPITTPKDFKNENITEMSNNLMTTAPIVVLRYANGSVVSFDYITGELVDMERVRSDASLLQYLDEKVADQAAPLLTIVKEGYVDAKLLESYLYVHPTMEALQVALEEMDVDTSTLIDIPGVEMQGEGDGMGTLDISGENEVNGSAFVDGEGESTNLAKMPIEDGVEADNNDVTNSDASMLEANEQGNVENKSNTLPPKTIIEQQQLGNLSTQEGVEGAEEPLLPNVPTATAGQGSKGVPLMPSAQNQNNATEQQGNVTTEQEGVTTGQEGITREQAGVHHDKNKGGTTAQPTVTGEVMSNEPNTEQNGIVPEATTTAKPEGSNKTESGAAVEKSAPVPGVAESGAGQPEAGAPGPGLGTIEGTRRQYVSVYDTKAKTYKIFDEKELLTKTETKPLLFVNTAVKEAVNNQKKVDRENSGMENKGVLFLLGAFTSIGGLLVFVYHRRSRVS